MSLEYDQTLIITGTSLEPHLREVEVKRWPSREAWEGERFIRRNPFWRLQPLNLSKNILPCQPLPSLEPSVVTTLNDLICQDLQPPSKRVHELDIAAGLLSFDLDGDQRASARAGPVGTT